MSNCFRGPKASVYPLTTSDECALTFNFVGDVKFEISNLKLLAENVSRQLRAWADSLQNSWIKGQRYLTDQDRQSAHARRRAREFEEHRRKIIEEGRQAMRDPADIEDTESEGER
ncbi:MAG: hypothetical protein JO252_11250 [Planctomycetaceae bacterium]|nr:hypothetical protein [Planctomycetaceae bacterium]